MGTPPFAPTLRYQTIERGGPGHRAAAGRARHSIPSGACTRASAGDDKAPIVAMVTALDAIRAGGLKTKSNIKFAFEGEEEAGSPNLEQILAANKELFAGDLWLMCDAPLHQTRRQS